MTDSKQKRDEYLRDLEAAENKAQVEFDTKLIEYQQREAIWRKKVEDHDKKIGDVRAKLEAFKAQVEEWKHLYGDPGDEKVKVRIAKYESEETDLLTKRAALLAERGADLKLFGVRLDAANEALAKARAALLGAKEIEEMLKDA